MEHVLAGLLLVGVIVAVSFGALGEVGLAATYARIWARLSDRRAKR